VCIVLTHIEAYRRGCRTYWLFRAARGFYERARLGKKPGETWVHLERAVSKQVTQSRRVLWPIITVVCSVHCDPLYYHKSPPSRPRIRERTWTITESLSNHYRPCTAFSQDFRRMFRSVLPPRHNDAIKGGRNKLYCSLCLKNSYILAKLNRSYPEMLLHGWGI